MLEAVLCTVVFGSSVQDLSAVLQCDLAHGDACPALSYTCVLALRGTAAGFCPANPGILINSVLCDSHHKGRKRRVR